MSLFEVFREKTVEVHSTEKAYPVFKTIGSISTILRELHGDTLLIMKNITDEVADWILRAESKCDIYTTEPDSVEELDALESISRKSAVYIVPSIDLNYIHCNDTLYIVPDRFTDSAASNLVMITAMTRKEIETQIAIDIGLIASRSGMEQAPLFEEEQISTETSAATEAPSSFAAKELELLRKEITKRMNERYSVVKTEMANASVERKAISLTPFYKRNGIARGRLRGSWELFDKADLSKIIDIGLAQRALAAVYKKHTVTIERAYRLIRKETLPEYQEAVTQIERNYGLYLLGKNPERVGQEIVRVPFLGREVISHSIGELKNYLLSIAPATPESKRNVEWFTNEAEKEALKGIETVSSNTVLNALSEDQLKDAAYVEKLWKAIAENESFFDDDLINLIARYAAALQR